MKKIFSSIIILTVVTNAFAQEAVELKLPNSNKVVIKLMFRNGSITDPAGKEGLTDMTTSIVADGGTKTMTKSQIDDKLYPWAASISGHTDKEVSIFTFECPVGNLNEFYPILKDVMTAPGFTKEDFDRIKSNQKNYVDEVIRSSSDEDYSKKALEDFLFRGTNYQHMVQGTSSGVNSITVEDVKAHYAAYYTPQNLTIGIAGNYTPDFLEKLKTDLQQLRKKDNTSSVVLMVPQRNMPDGIQVEVISKDNALGSAIFMGFPMDITRSNDDFAALMVANSWLGEHRKSYSHLYQKIRAERSMNYGDYSYIEWYNNGGSNMLPPAGVPRSSNYFSIWIRPVQTATGLKKQYPELANIEVGHAHFAIRMALHEMDKLITSGMSKEDFESTRTFLRSYMKLYVQSPEQQLGYLMDSKFYNRTNYLAEMDKLLATMTLDQVNKAMKKYWQVKNMYITIVTDRSEAEPLAKSLKANTPSPMSYSNVLKPSLSPEILKYDEEIQNYPLNIHNVKIVDSKDTFGGIQGAGTGK